MKILYVNPPNPAGSTWFRRDLYHTWQDNGVANNYVVPSIMGLVRQQSPDVEQLFIDLTLAPETEADYKKRVREINPDLMVLLISAYYIPHDVRMALPDYPVIGIITPTFVDPKEALFLYDMPLPYFTNCDEVEVIVSNAVKEFRRRGRLSETKGLVINGSGQILDTGHADFSDLSKFPLPAYDLGLMDAYREKQSKVHRNYKPEILGLGVIHTQKGCPNECKFCGGSGAHMISREKTSEQAFDEVRLLCTKFNTRRIIFSNAEFFTDISEAKKFCNYIIHSGLDVELICNNRVEFVDEDLIALMKKAGFTVVRYGIETADPALQKKINKNVDLKLAGRIIRATQDAGIKVLVCMMVGFEGETKKSLNMNADFLAKNGIDMFTDGILHVIPCTKMYYELKNNGRLLESDWMEFKLNRRLVFTNSSYRNMHEMEKARLYMRRRYFIKRASSFFKQKKYRYAIDCATNYLLEFDAVNALRRYMRIKMTDTALGRLLRKLIWLLAHQVKRNPYDID